MNDIVYYSPPQNEGGFLDKEGSESIEKVIDDKLAEISFVHLDDFSTFIGEFKDLKRDLDTKVGQKEIVALGEYLNHLDKSMKTAFDLSRIRAAFQNNGVFNFNSAVNISDNPAIEDSQNTEGDMYWDYVNKRLRLHSGDRWETIHNG